jgi:hypothetical protein
MKKGFRNTPQMRPGRLEELLYGKPLPELKRGEMQPPTLSAGAIQARELMEKHAQTKPKEPSNMTVSLYMSTASGKREVVVQTNAQSLDLFIAGLADAVDAAMDSLPSNDRAELLAGLFRNAFPVAFAIAGYKADKVTESRMLICGAAAPDKSSLLAHSRS